MRAAQSAPVEGGWIILPIPVALPVLHAVAPEGGGHTVTIGHG